MFCLVVLGHILLALGGSPSKHSGYPYNKRFKLGLDNHTYLQLDSVGEFGLGGLFCQQRLLVLP